MALPSSLGPATPAECDRLAQHYSAEAAHDRGLALALRKDGAPEAADLNDRRARRLDRTAQILSAYAREIEMRTAAADRELEAAE